MLIALQIRLWAGDGSLAEVSYLDTKIQSQIDENARLQARNARLEAEVEDLKRGVAAIDRRARRDLGMIGPNETFFQFVED
jgi:cell division protein FtsB